MTFSSENPCSKISGVLVVFRNAGDHLGGDSVRYRWLVHHESVRVTESAASVHAAVI